MTGKSQIKSQNVPENDLNQLASSQVVFPSHPKSFKSNFKSHHDLLTRVFVVQVKVESSKVMKSWVKSHPRLRFAHHCCVSVAASIVLNGIHHATLRVYLLNCQALEELRQFMVEKKTGEALKEKQKLMRNLRVSDISPGLLAPPACCRERKCAENYNESELSVGWVDQWVGLDRVTQNGPTDNSVTNNNNNNDRLTALDVFRNSVTNDTINLFFKLQSAFW